MEDYIAMTSQSFMTLSEDSIVSGALFIGLSLLATVMFPAAMPKFKGDRKIYRNSANFESIFDISSPCRSELKDLQMCAGRQKALQQNIST
jgi:hypothetical protein